jgi:hypothetical protein
MRKKELHHSRQKSNGAINIFARNPFQLPEKLPSAHVTSHVYITFCQIAPIRRKTCVFYAIVLLLVLVHLNVTSCKDTVQSHCRHCLLVTACQVVTIHDAALTPVHVTYLHVIPHEQFEPEFFEKEHQDEARAAIIW